MKKKFPTAFAASAVLLLLIIQTQTVEVANANFHPPPIYAVHIHSPFFDTYPCSSVEVNFTARYRGSVPSEYAVSFWLILDEQEPIQVTNRTTTHYNFRYLGNDFPDDTIEGRTFLANVANGLHNLTIEMRTRPVNSNITLTRLLCSAWRQFAINAPLPVVSEVSIENKTYLTNSLPLTFKVAGMDLSTHYNIDNQANVTINGNTTLTNIPDGCHNITVYAKDPAGNIGKSKTIFFTIQTQPQPTNTPAEAPSPSIPEFPIWAIPALFVMLLASVVVFKRRVRII